MPVIAIVDVFPVSPKLLETSKSTVASSPSTVKETVSEALDVISILPVKVSASTI